MTKLLIVALLIPGSGGYADDVDEEDRRPTQRRRIMEEAQAGGFDENMEPLVLSIAQCTPAKFH